MTSFLFDVVPSEVFWLGIRVGYFVLIVCLKKAKNLIYKDICFVLGFFFK